MKVMRGVYNVTDEVFSKEIITNKYLSGSGIEIGALCNPLLVPQDAKVLYVDRLSIEGLREHYPELNDMELVKVDIIDDGERLEMIGNTTQDFVIANHFIEHCANPILTVSNMLRVLKKNGILFISLPDKRQCFDVDRPETTFEHLMRDYEEGPDWSRKAHFEEWSRLVNKVSGEREVKENVARLMEMDYSIHYHVFTPDTMLEFFSKIKDVLHYPFEYELFYKNGAEVIIVLKRI
ncbi:MAG: Methyltransferase domain protein [Deltaproteobacteria bacterium ADurb.Bin151]|nr:MAG: Methyltransferase domain protein [Deltaproteobacteria bacterium ADurb.Bin151]